MRYLFILFLFLGYRKPNPSVKNFPFPLFPFFHFLKELESVLYWFLPSLSKLFIFNRFSKMFTDHFIQRRRIRLWRVSGKFSITFLPGYLITLWKKKKRPDYFPTEHNFSVSKKILLCKIPSFKEQRKRVGLSPPRKSSY